MRRSVTANSKNEKVFNIRNTKVIIRKDLENKQS
jgi:hypothetical protein